MTSARLVSEAEVLGLVSDIYAIPASPEAMATAFERIARLFNAKGLLIGPLPGSEPPQEAVVAYASEAFHEALPDYLGHYVGISPRRAWLQAGRHRDIVFTDLDILDERALRRNPFYADFLGGHGNMYSLDRLGERPGGHRLWIAAQFDARAASPGAEDKALFRLITDHLLQSLDLLRHMVAGPRVTADLVDRFEMPALVLSGGGRILHRNAAAEAFCDDRLSLAGGRLSAPAQRDARRIDALLAAAAQRMTGAAAPDFVAIGGEGAGPPLLLRIGPVQLPGFGGALPGFYADTPRFLVLIHAPGRGRAPKVAGLLQHLGLTRPRRGWPIWWRGG